MLPGRSDNAVKNTFHSINNKGLVGHYAHLYVEMGAPRMAPQQDAPPTALAAAQIAAAQYEAVTIVCPPLPEAGRRASKRTLESASSEEAATLVQEAPKRARRSPPSESQPQRTSLRIALRRQRSEERSDVEASPRAPSFSTVFNGEAITCQASGSTDAPCSTYSCVSTELAFELPEVPHTASQPSIVRWMSTWSPDVVVVYTSPTPTVLHIASMQA